MGNAGWSKFQAGSLKQGKASGKRKPWWIKRWWLVSGGGLAIVALATGVVLASQPEYVTAPEVPKILAAQEGLNFGILIPTYIPRGFDREAVELKVDKLSGPSGEPMVDLVYRNLGKKAAIFIRQWVPGNPEMETLSKSAPVETRWGKGYLMTQRGSGIADLWVTIGQLHVSVSSSNIKVASPEQLVQMANTLGLASEDQSYTFKMDPLEIHGVAPPPPFEVQTNDAGIQEFNLTITPGGYSPIRFAVKKGIPVRINFRTLGEVGCGNVGFIAQPEGNIGISVSKESPLSIVEFTPKTAGEFPFNCSHYTFRGMMTVRE